jgi:hypothetical protein
LTTTAPVSLGSITSPYIRILTYGGPGVGKSILAMSSQKRMTFAFDVDDGALSAHRYAIKNGRDPNWVHIWPVKSSDDFYKGFEWFTANIHRYQLVVVDTATELQQMLLEDARIAANLPIASKREWGMVFTGMENIMRSFRHLPVHVMWVAHETDKEDEYFRRIMYRPSFQGQFGTHCEKHFSEVWRYCLFEQQIRVEGPENRLETVTHRLLQCNRDQFSRAKDRSMSLDPFEPPELDYLLDKMIAGVVANNIDLNSEGDINNA